MTALAGPFYIVCTILGLGGVAKVWAPLPARRALRGVGAEVPVAAVRLLGGAEVALACAGAFRAGTILPMMVGMAYVAFAAFVVLMLRSDAGTSCGCFGSASAPPSVLHVVANLVSAGVAFAAIGLAGLPDVLGDQPVEGVPLMALVVVGSYATYLLLTVLPVVLAPPRAAAAEFALTDRRGASA